MSIAKTSRPRRPGARAKLAQARRRPRRGTRPPGAAPPPRPRPGRRRRRRPSRSAPRAATCRRTGRGRGRRDSRRATRATGSPPSRSAAPPGPASVATGASASSGSSWALWSTQNQLDAVFGQAPLQAGRVGALRQPEAAVPAEAAPVRADAGVELQPQPRRGSPAAAAPRGSPPRRPARPGPPRAARWNGAQRVAAVRVEQLQRVLVALQLAFAGVAALGRRPRRRSASAAPIRHSTRKRRSRSLTPASSSWSARTGVTVIVRPSATSSTGR